MTTSNFACEHRFSPGGEIDEITMWRSKATGLRAIVADIAGPLVNGYFALATESHCNDGCPHTLEHLIFLGSEDYPWKGVLDELSNRSLAQGTNAWTDTDHTCYTVTTAGWEGFNNILPVYLDHILYPTLTDSGFVTEVHHVNGEGHDAGVVYCEMQARENTASSLCHLRMFQLCFEGSGFASETGGLMADLRTLDVETVRSFHKSFYRTENLCIIVTGRVNADDLINTLATFEQKIVGKGVQERIQRPWSEKVTPLKEDRVETVDFPTDDENIGRVSIGWHGPEWSDSLTALALSLWWRYLSETAVAPLQKEMVECDPPLCSLVEHDLTELSTLLSVITFSDAPTETLDDIRNKFFDVVTRARDEIDLKRLQRILKKEKREFFSTLEEDPHDFTCNKAIEVFLYADKPSEFENRFNVASQIDTLISYPVSYWQKLCDDYILKRKSVCIIGRPSAAAAKTLADTESSRIEAQIASLGPQRLQQLAEDLEASEASNEVTVPDSVLERVAIPDIAQVPQFKIYNSRHRASHEGNGPFASSDLHMFPSLQVAHMRSRFVEVRALFDTGVLSSFSSSSSAAAAAPVDASFRSFLPLFVDTMFESNIELKDGKILSHSQVIAALDELSVSYDCHSGLCPSPAFSSGAFEQLLCINLRFEIENYQEAIEWLRNAVQGVQFTEERVRVSATRLLNSIPALKRKGQKVVRSAVDNIHFNSASNHVASGIYAQEHFLQGLLSDLQESPDKVLSQLLNLQKLLNSTVSFFLVTDTSVPASITAPFQNFFSDLQNGSMASPSFSRSNLRAQKSCAHLLTVVGLESSYLLRTRMSVPDSFDHEDLAPLQLVIEYLCALEGPFWKRIRGLGLAYGYSLYASVESSALTFALHRSTDVVAAFVEAHNVVDEIIKNGFVKNAIEAARSSLAYGLISRSDTLISAANEQLRETLLRVPPGLTRRSLTKIAGVTADEMSSVLVRYIRPLFSYNSEENESLVISCGPSQAGDITSAFHSSFQFQLQQNTADSFFHATL